MEIDSNSFRSHFNDLDSLLDPYSLSVKPIIEKSFDMSSLQLSQGELYIRGDGNGKLLRPINRLTPISAEMLGCDFLESSITQKGRNSRFSLGGESDYP